MSVVFFKETGDEQTFQQIYVMTYVVWTLADVSQQACRSVWKTIQATPGEKKLSKTKKRVASILEILTSESGFRH